MSAATSLATTQKFGSVKSILTELNVNFQQQADIRETLEAKGVPAATINMLCNMLASNSTTEFDALCQTAAKVAFDQYGDSASTLDEVKTAAQKLQELDEDAAYIRRIARGMELNPQAINMLTNIIRQNPGDGGQKMLNELVDYAGQYGIKLQGLRLVETDSTEPATVLPQIDILQPNTQGLLKYKDIVVELAVALVVTVSALMLLT